MNYRTRLNLLAASAVIASASCLEAQTAWSTVFSESFSLNGTTRVAGGDPNNVVVENPASMKLWRRNNTTSFGPAGGIVANTEGTYGIGAVHLGIGYPTSPGPGPHFGQFTTGELRATASVTIGDVSPTGWVGIAFLGNPDAPWFGGTNNSNPLWIRIGSDGFLTVDGTWLSWQGRQSGDPLPSVQIDALAGFTTTSPIEIGLSYNLETFGVDVLFNGQSVLSSYGLFTKNASNTPATMLIMNGAGLYIEGSTNAGILPTVHSLTVEHGTAIPEPSSAALAAGALALFAGLNSRARSRARRLSLAS